MGVEAGWAPRKHGCILWPMHISEEDDLAINLSYVPDMKPGLEWVPGILPGSLCRSGLP